jgi:hypothetical protein
MEKRLHDGRVRWQRVVFDYWYGHHNQEMLLTSGTAIWDSNKGYRVPLKWVLLKDPQHKLDPVLLASSNLNIEAADMVRFFVRRWRVEVTFAEVRRHLGVETQRQWSDLAIERSTPVLLALKSIICLLANDLYRSGKIQIQTTAWYGKTHFTFSDILAAVRQQIWAFNQFPTSSQKAQVGNWKDTIRYLWQTLILTAA